MRRRVPLAALCLTAAAALAGCGTASGTDPVRPVATTTGVSVPLTDRADADSQYRGIQVGLNLPAGVRFPAHLPGTADRYPAGAGQVTAQNYWLCAWLWSYLDGGTGAAARQLPKYQRMNAYAALDAGSRRRVDGAIRAAQGGGRGAVTSFTTATCGGPFYGQARAAG